jgi:hypothetical protein
MRAVPLITVITASLATLVAFGAPARAAEVVPCQAPQARAVPCDQGKAPCLPAERPCND